MVLLDLAIGAVLCALILGWDRWKKSAMRAEVAAEQRRTSGVDQVLCSCGARDAEKVGIGTRAASGVLGGLVFSRKARAQFHCRNCNRYW